MNLSILATIWALATVTEPQMVQAAQSAQAAQVAEPYTIAEQTLQSAWAEAETCAEELGLEAGDRPAVRIVTQAELRDSLLAESSQALAHHFDDAQAADAQLAAFAEGQSRILLAKYVWDEDAILVPTGNIEAFARDLELPGLCQQASLRALLVHELVHAADQRQYSFSKVLAGLEDWERVRAYSAVIEGHAQDRARKLCADRGWSEGFELFSSAIGSLPKSVDDDPGAKLLLQMFSAVMQTSYRQGETFMAAVMKDELLKEGSIRIVESSYEAVQEGEFEGIYCTKELSVGGQEQHMWVLTGSLGSLSVEIAYVQETTADTTLVPMALEVLKAADILAQPVKSEAEAEGER